MVLKLDGVGSEPTDALPGEVVAHTLTNDANSGVGNLALRFTAPVEGVAQISGSVWDAQLSVVRDQVWEVWFGCSMAASGLVFGKSSAGRSASDLFSNADVLLPPSMVAELRIRRADDSKGGLVGVSFNVESHRSPSPTPGRC